MNKSKLSKQLAYLSANISNEFDNPFDDDDDLHSGTIDIEKLKKPKPSKKSSDSKKVDKDKEKFKKIMGKGDALLDRYADDIIADFDVYLENRFLEDEDALLKNSLVSMGRRYARDTSISAEESEIHKAFSAGEKRLEKLLAEIDKDKGYVQKDIDILRTARTRNSKTLSELITAKSQFHNISLSIVKEMNNIKKTQLDLKYKADKLKPEENASDLVSGKAIQQLFGMGRENMISTVGGYEGSSGAFEGSVPEDTGEYDDEIIQKAYFSNEEETDGDKFLRYENLGVEYILILGPNGSKDVIAEDKDGNIVPDYPIPQNLDEMNFDISESTMSAKDDYHRNYKLRIEYDDEE